MADPKLVQAQVELVAGATKVVKGTIEPERAFAGGALGVVVHGASDSRGLLNREFKSTFIPWSQIRMIHVDL